MIWTRGGLDACTLWHSTQILLETMVMVIIKNIRGTEGDT